MLEVLPHAVDLEPVGQTRQRVRLEERAQGRGVVGRDALVGIEGEDPVRVELRGGLEQAVAVRRVVPADVVGPWRVVQHDLDERAGVQDLPRGVSAAVVEGDDGVGKRATDPDSRGGRLRRCGPAAGRRRRCSATLLSFDGQARVSQVSQDLPGDIGLIMLVHGVPITGVSSMPIPVKSTQSPG